MTFRRNAGLLFAAALVGILPVAAFAAEPSPAFQAELSRIFEKREYTPAPFGPARWLDGGKSYTTLEAAAGKDSAGSKDIVAYDTASGRREVLVPASKLVPAGATKPLTIEDYAWSSGRSRLLVFTNSKKVWRTNTRGDYWVLELATGALRKLGGTAPESSLMFAKFSPDGTRVAWVRDNDLWVEDLASSRII